MQTRALSTRLGIPIFWGTDAVHGNALVRGATMFPHNIGMGCTRNLSWLRRSDGPQL